MGFLQKLMGSVSGNVAEVDSDSQLLVRTATDPAKVGYTGLVGRSEPGAAGSARIKPIWGTVNNRLPVAIDNVFWDDTFNATALNTSKYNFAATTQTGAMAGGFLTLNNSGITTINTNSAIRTQRTFPLLGSAELKVITSAFMAPATTHVANSVIEFGLLTATLPGGAAPTDGAFFRYNAASELRGVISFNGTETQTVAITKPAAGTNHDYMIVITNETVEFWIDREFHAEISLLAHAPSLGQPFLQGTLPWCARQYIGGAAPASATKFQITDVYIKLNGKALERSWSEAKAGMGHSAYQGQNGGTMGSTGQNANNTNPAAAVPTNTTAALGAGLGGLFQETLTLAAGTDGIISSFQNPVGGVNQTPRNLIIRGVYVSGVVTVALTTNPLAGTMSLNFGYTNVSLATAESGSFVSPTTKAARRIALGTTSIASATAAPGTPVLGLPMTLVTFTSPIVLSPGEFVSISHKKISAAPATGAVMWAITFDAHYE